MISVSSAAVSRALLTTSEGKTALGLTGSTYDTAVDAMVLRVSDLVARECLVPSDGVNPPTFLSETIVETVRLSSGRYELLVSRRPVTSISSVVEDGETLSADDYELTKVSGTLLRLDADGNPTTWAAAKIVVTYVAGYASVPVDLKLAAEQVLREQWSAKSRDPLLRGETVEGVGRLDYWVAAVGSQSTTSAVSPTAAAMLDAYRYFPV